MQLVPKLLKEPPILGNVTSLTTMSTYPLAHKVHDDAEKHQHAIDDCHRGHPRRQWLLHDINAYDIVSKAVRTHADNNVRNFSRYPNGGLPATDTASCKPAFVHAACRVHDAANSRALFICSPSRRNIPLNEHQGCSISAVRIYTEFPTRPGTWRHGRRRSRYSTRPRLPRAPAGPRCGEQCSSICALARRWGQGGRSRGGPARNAMSMSSVRTITSKTVRTSELQPRAKRKKEGQHKFGPSSLTCSFENCDQISRASSSIQTIYVFPAAWTPHACRLE